MITGRQIRAARAVLGWSLEELSKASGVAVDILKTMEKATAAPPVANAAIIRVRNAFEHKGIIFDYRGVSWRFE